ncbi:MAG: hypothetical protein JWM28_10, partial [Chitinophagaceae bacterium]|nr:hypothetical protein [Chitinophagaceae bacterium]
HVNSLELQTQQIGGEIVQFSKLKAGMSPFF